MAYGLVLYFVHLNKKQNSREGIERYKKLKGNLTSELKQISELSEAFLTIYLKVIQLI